MEVTLSSLSGVVELVPRRHGDERGWFVELWNARTLAAAGIAAEFVQDNLSFSARRFTVRGLHLQVAPAAQGKLVWAPRGRVFDVAVDLRPGSPSFGRHAVHVLSRERGNMLWVPPGFAHGYCTLEDESEVAYKVTAFYDPAAERGLRWDDPALGIPWPTTAAEAIVSPRDRALPLLAEFQSV